MSDKKKKLVSHVKKLVEVFTKPKVAEAEAPWVKHVALLTGVLAAVAGFLTVRMTILTNDAIYLSNQAILAQTEASDVWTEYQADSIKARIVETQLIPSNPLEASDRTALMKADEELRARQPESRKTAEEKTQFRKDHMEQSRQRLGEKDLLGYASLAAQLGIALASVAAMSRQRLAFQAGLGAGIVALGILALAFFQGGLLS